MTATGEVGIPGDYDIHCRATHDAQWQACAMAGLEVIAPSSTLSVYAELVLSQLQPRRLGTVYRTAPVRRHLT